MADDSRPPGLALLVVDVQVGAVELGPYRGDEVLANIAELVGACREHGVEVVHVQHDGEPGSDVAVGAPGWPLHPSVAPVGAEKVVRKRFNSAFRETDLLEHLRSRGVGTLVIVGIQTEYCVDTTCRVAFEHGFRIVVPELTNTTYDNGELTAREIHEHHNRRIFDGRFATVTTMAEALATIRGHPPS